MFRRSLLPPSSRCKKSSLVRRIPEDLIQHLWKNLESREYDSALSYETLDLICVTYCRLLVREVTNDS